MIERVLLHVAGPTGAGKTMLIEALLRSLDQDATCVRAIQDETLHRPKESRPRSHPELRRYKSAGAGTVAVYRFPSTHADGETFYMTDLMMDCAPVVVIEGDRPLEYVNLTTFVAPVLPKGSTLLRRVLREHETERAQVIALLERALDSPEELPRFLLRDFGEAAVQLALKRPGMIEDMRATVAAHLAKLRAAPPPEPTEHWGLAPGHEGIERAQLVIINARNESERSRGGLHLQEIARLRKDDAVFKDVIGLLGRKVPITAVVANLSDARDPGLKKGLARIRRAVRSTA